MDVPEPAVVESVEAPADEPDTSVLIERARQTIRNLPGCFVVQGDAHDRYDAGLFGKGERHWNLSGTIENGVWTTYVATVAADSPDKPDDKEKRDSIFGRRPEAEEDGVEGKQSLIQALQDDVTMEYVERSDTGWTLVRTLRGGKAGRNLLTLGFDPAWQPHHFAIKIVDPVVVKGERGRGKIVWMDVAVETTAQGGPGSERLDAVFAAWPFSVEVHSLTIWTATSCGS